MHSYNTQKCALQATCVLFALGSIAARPYQDTKQRFALTVADGWRLAPQFGDTSGMVFARDVARRDGGGTALLIVRADPIGGRSLAVFVDEVESTFAKLPGYRARGEKAVTLDGRPAVRKQYRTKDRRLTSTFSEANGFFYLVHFEAPRRAAKRLWPQARRMLDSFRLGSARARSPVGQRTSLSRDVEAPVGRWKSDSGLELVLDDDGGYRLADVRGTYRVDGTTLVLSRPGGGRQSFTYEHDADRGRLVLTSPKLPEPIVYRQIYDERGSKKRLIGKWRAQKVKPAFELSLSAGGKFVLGPYNGQWAAKDGALLLKKSQTESITYKYHFEGKRLVLSGADLDQPVSFERIGS